MPENSEDYPRFIESPNFPIDIINEASNREKKGRGRPPYWEMVFWWTRKPLASARSIIAGALLPHDYPRDKFIRMLHLHVMHDKRAKWKSPHRYNPTIPRDIYKKYFKGKSLLDPFAGFGSIPLEALRLGLSKVVAVELLPTAYIFLKAVLEYPYKASTDPKWRNLARDVEKYGKEIIEKLREDPDIKELYDDDVAVYIGTWEIKHGNHWTPLIGNWWLARVQAEKKVGGKKIKIWKALAWMQPERVGEQVRIKVVDAKKTYEKKLNDIKTFKEGKRIVGIEVNGERIYVGWDKLHGQPNIDAGNEKAVCLYCGGEITNKVADPKTKKNVWYVKYAIRLWNRLLELYLEEKISLEELKEKSPARPVILVKVKQIKNRAEFETATDKDNEKLWKALEKLRQLWGDPDIPTEIIPGYDNRNLMTYSWGNDKWFKLFNPRQLLTLIKLVKLIRKMGKQIEKDKLKQGWSRDEAFKYAEAVTTYLAIALVRSADYNSIVTRLHPGNPHGVEVEESLSTRGISITWNFGETNPFVTKVESFQIQGSWAKSLAKEIEGLSYLLNKMTLAGFNNILNIISEKEDSNRKDIKVVHDNALLLTKLNNKFDLIVTDPPYHDDVPYSELSDFYYVWLKRALSDSDEYSLIPRFHKGAFFDEWGNEIETQWSAFARSEITLNIARYKYLSLIKENEEVKSKGKEFYAGMLARTFETMASKLKDNGLLITYFAHSDPDAWKALIYSGWKRAGLLVSSAYPLITESEESVVSRGKASITASIVVVWRKRGKENPGEILDLATKKEELAELLSKEFRRYIRMGLHGTTLYVMLYARALSEMTKYSKVMDGARELSVDDIVLEASKLVANAMVKGANPEIVTPEATFYLLFKLVGIRPEKKSRRKLPSSDLILVGYGTLSLDKAEKVKLVVPAKSKSSEEEEEFEEGASVAKRKVYDLIEPLEDSEDAVLKVLGLKNVDPSKPETMRTSVDVLHVLELYADRGAEEVKRKYAELSQALGWKAKEAIELAKSLVYLEKWKAPEKRDPEAVRCERLLNQLGISVEEGG